jgi:hypothetical protein
MSKLLPSIASLFKTGANRGVEQQLYCSTEPPKAPPTTCDSENCRRGCRPRKASLDICNSEDDASGDDSGNDSYGGIASETSSQSSEEDNLDAFADVLLHEHQQSGVYFSSSARKAQSKTSNEKPKEKLKSERQKGDAASLKQYAYGKI